MNISMDARVRAALKQRPTRVSDLAEIMGDSEKTRTLIIQSYLDDELPLAKINEANLLISSLVLLLMVELVPGSIRAVLSLPVLFVIPYIWTRRGLHEMKYDEYYALPLVIGEIMIIGFILGYTSNLSQINISISLLISTLGKYGLLVYFK